MIKLGEAANEFFRHLPGRLTPNRAKLPWDPRIRTGLTRYTEEHVPAQVGSRGRLACPLGVLVKLPGVLVSEFSVCLMDFL